MLGFSRITINPRAISIPRAIRTSRPFCSPIRQLHSATTGTAHNSVYFPATDTTSLELESPSNSRISQQRTDTAFNWQGTSDVSPVDPQVTVATSTHHDLYWRRVPQWKDISEGQFISYQWTVRHFLAQLIIVNRFQIHQLTS